MKIVDCLLEIVDFEGGKSKNLGLAPNPNQENP
jgi:hypothetical protein